MTVVSRWLSKSSTLSSVAARQRKLWQDLHHHHHHQRRRTARLLPVWRATQPRGGNARTLGPEVWWRPEVEVDRWRHRGSRTAGRVVTCARTAASVTRAATAWRSTCARTPGTSRCSAPSAGDRSATRATSTNTSDCTPATRRRRTAVDTAARCLYDDETLNDMSALDIRTQSSSSPHRRHSSNCQGPVVIYRLRATFLPLSTTWCYVTVNVASMQPCSKY